MPQTLRNLWKWTALAACATALPATVLAQANTKTTYEQLVKFEIVSVEGNTVIVRGQNGAKEFTATEDQRFNVDGKQVSVHELKPGMKGTAKITTTTTLVPVKVTEVKEGEVMQASGNSIVVRTPAGIKMFTEGDIAKRNITIIKDGQPAKMSDFHQGDKLTATIVTEGTPKVLSKREVDAGTQRSAAPVGSSTKGRGGRGASAEASGGPETSRGGGTARQGHEWDPGKFGRREEAAEDRKLSAAVGGNGRIVSDAWRDADRRAEANAVVERSFKGRREAGPSWDCRDWSARRGEHRLASPDGPVDITRDGALR